MTDPRDIAALVRAMAGAWRPIMFALTTIFGGFLVTATFSKHALGRIEDGVRSLVNTGRQVWRAPPVQRGEQVPVGSDQAANQWIEYAPETQPKPEPRSETETPQLAEAATPLVADLASQPSVLQTADGDHILGRYCKMDTATTLEGLEFTIEVPGLKETDLEIRMVGDTIIVSGQPGQDRTDKTFRVVEREYGPFSRCIKISEGVPLHRIQASLDRGLLTVFVPNPTVQVGATIAVNAAVRRIFDGDGVYELKLDLPGVDESDVDLAIRDGMLTISCRRDAGDAQSEGRTENDLAPRLLQSMEVPAGVDADQIRAVLAKGVLTVTLPIAAGHRQRTIPLQAIGAPDRREIRTGGSGAERPPSAVARCPSEAPIDAQTPLPFDFWIAGETGLGGGGPHG